MANSAHNAGAMDIDSPISLTSSPRYSPTPSPPPPEPAPERSDLRPVRIVNSDQPLPDVKTHSPEGLTSSGETSPAPPPSPRPAIHAASSIPYYTPPPPPRPRSARLPSFTEFVRSTQAPSEENVRPPAISAGDNALGSPLLTRSFSPTRMVTNRPSNVDNGRRRLSDAETKFFHIDPPPAGKEDAGSGSTKPLSGPLRRFGDLTRKGLASVLPKGRFGEFNEEKAIPQHREERNADFWTRIARETRARMGAKLAPENADSSAKEGNETQPQRPGESVADFRDRIVRDGGAMSSGPGGKVGNGRPQSSPQERLLSHSESSDLNGFFGDQRDFRKVEFLQPLGASHFASGQQLGFGKGQADIEEAEDQLLQQAIAESLKEAKQELDDDYYAPTPLPVPTAMGPPKRRRREHQEQKEELKTTLRLKKGMDGKWRAGDTRERFLRDGRRGQDILQPEATARKIEREGTPVHGLPMRKTSITDTAPTLEQAEMESTDRQNLSSGYRGSAAEDDIGRGRSRTELELRPRRSRSSSLVPNIVNHGSTTYIPANESDPTLVENSDGQHSLKDTRDYYTQLARDTAAEGLRKLRAKRFAETRDIDDLFPPKPREHKVQENPLDMMYLRDASNRVDTGPKLETAWGGPIRNPLGVERRSPAHPHPSSQGHLTPLYGAKKRTRSLSEPTPAKKQRKQLKRLATAPPVNGDYDSECFDDGEDLVLPEGKEECCAYCNKRGGPLTVCARCRKEAYCSTDCSSTHWKWHKDICKTWSDAWDRDLHKAQTRQDLPQAARQEDSPYCSPVDVITTDHDERESADPKERLPSFNPVDVKILSFKETADNRRFQYALQTSTGVTWVDGAEMTGNAWRAKLNNFYDDLEDPALLLVTEYLSYPPNCSDDPGIFKGRFIVKAETNDDRFITFDVREPEDYSGSEGWLDGDALGPEWDGALKDFWTHLYAVVQREVTKKEVETILKPRETDYQKWDLSFLDDI